MVKKSKGVYSKLAIISFIFAVYVPFIVLLQFTRAFNMIPYYVSMIMYLFFFISPFLAVILGSFSYIIINRRKTRGIGLAIASIVIGLSFSMFIVWLMTRPPVPIP